VPEDGGSTDLRNVDILPQHYTASPPRRPRLDAESSSSHKQLLPATKLNIMKKHSYTISSSLHMQHENCLRPSIIHFFHAFVTVIGIMADEMARKLYYVSRDEVYIRSWKCTSFSSNHMPWKVTLPSETYCYCYGKSLYCWKHQLLYLDVGLFT
jgi:hypothetical protein